MDLLEKRELINKVDAKMKALFLERMDIVKDIALYKKENGMEIFDEKREAEMKKRLTQDLEEPLRSLYLAFLETTVDVSKKYQALKIDE